MSSSPASRSSTIDLGPRDFQDVAMAAAAAPGVELRAESVTSNAGVLRWVAPEGHKRLRAFNILLVSHDTKINRELAVKHNPDTAVNSFFVKNILPGAQYTVTITSVCVFEILKSESEPETKILTLRGEDRRAVYSLKSQFTISPHFPVLECYFHKSISSKLQDDGAKSGTEERKESGLITLNVQLCSQVPCLVSISLYL